MTLLALSQGIGNCCGPGTWEIAWRLAGVVGVFVAIVGLATWAIVALVREVRRG